MSPSAATPAAFRRDASAGRSLTQTFTPGCQGILLLLLMYKEVKSLIAYALTRLELLRIARRIRFPSVPLIDRSSIFSAFRINNLRTVS